jgi:magnesium-transporting ATPase (P-type)
VSGAAFNVIMTFLPIIILGCFDKDVTAEAALSYPSLYATGQKKNDLNERKMLQHILTAALHSTVLFFLVYGVFSDGAVTVRFQRWRSNSVLG